LAPREDLLVLDAGTAPENITGTLRRFAPDWVILMDAVDLGKPAGAVEWLSLDMVEGMDAFTHGLPPLLFGQFLKSELGCQVGLIGVQPASLAFDHPVHPAVRASIAKIARKLISLFS
jgi:hydrogenase 3 maturation protease